MKVLVVEDNPVNQVLMHEILELLNCEVVEAISGQLALTELENFCPDIIFMDINLPDIDGIEVTRLIREKGCCVDALIYAVTASAMKGDEEKFKSEGFDGYLAKPITIKVIKDVINSCK